MESREVASESVKLICEDPRKLTREEPDDDAGKEDDEETDDCHNDRLPAFRDTVFITRCGEDPETSDDHEDDCDEREEGENEVADQCPRARSENRPDGL